MNNAEIEGIIIDYYGTTADHKSDQKIAFHKFLIADESGSIDMFLVGEIGSHFRPMQILRISGVRIRIWHNKISVYVNKVGGRIVRLGEFRMLFRPQPNLSDMEWIKRPPHGEWTPVQKGKSDELNDAIEKEKSARISEPSSVSNGITTVPQPPVPVMAASAPFAGHPTINQAGEMSGPSVMSAIQNPAQVARSQPQVMAPDMADTLNRAVAQVNDLMEQARRNEISQFDPELLDATRELISLLQKSYNEHKAGIVSMNGQLFQSITKLLSDLSALPPDT